MKDKKWIWVIGFLTITGMIGKRFLKIGNCETSSQS